MQQNFNAALKTLTRAKDVEIQENLSPKTKAKIEKSNEKAKKKMAKEDKKAMAAVKGTTSKTKKKTKKKDQDDEDYRPKQQKSGTIKKKKEKPRQQGQFLYSSSFYIGLDIFLDNHNRRKAARENNESEETIQQFLPNRLRKRFEK
jgi:hypothetical protein